MKYSTIRGIIIGIGIAMLGLSCAEQSSVPKSTVPQATVTRSGEIDSGAEFAGTIEKIDAEEGIIRVEHWPLSKTFRVPPECVIDVPASARTGLAQLKVGDPVVVTYSGEGDKLVANRIVRRGRAFAKEHEEQLERLDEMLNPSPNQ